MKLLGRRRLRVAVGLSALIACTNLASCDSPTETTTETATSALAAEDVRISWRMFEKFGTDWDGDGLPDMVPPASALARSNIPVSLSACETAPPGQGALVYWWDVPTASGTTTIASQFCSIVHVFPALGTYAVRLRVAYQSGALVDRTETLELKDYLIVSMGDSVASGEGNPDIDHQYPARPLNQFDRGVPAKWNNQRCHRSMNSGHARAALALEKNDPHSSVTFISLACSGASIAVGLLGPYRGQEESSPALLPQVDATANLLCNASSCWSRKDDASVRKIDAVLLTVGANDIGFGDIVRACGSPVNDCSKDNDVKRQLKASLDRLPRLYTDLDTSLRLRLDPRSVVLTGYFDVTTSDTGAQCQKIVFTDAALVVVDGVIESDEIKFAREEVMQPLNAAVEDAARAHGWHYVPTADGFFGHGYCSNDSYIVRYEESFRRQGNQTGTMHPNVAGHQVYADRIYAKLTEVLSRPAAEPTWARHKPLVGDWDGDSIDDLGVFNPDTGHWIIKRTTNIAPVAPAMWGGGTNVPLVGEFARERVRLPPGGFSFNLRTVVRSGLAVYQRQGGLWFTRVAPVWDAPIWYDQSPIPNYPIVASEQQWGYADDAPLIGDFDQDGLRDDFAVFRPGNQQWWIRTLEGSVLVAGMVHGFPGDVPIVGDFDGDGFEDDLGVWSPAHGMWTAVRTDGSLIFVNQQWGVPGDIPLVGDMDGDGFKDDLVVYRPSDGTWWARRIDGAWLLANYRWGVNGDVPFVGSFDGDGRKNDIGVYRPSEGQWYLIRPRDSALIHAPL